MSTDDKGIEALWIEEAVRRDRELDADPGRAIPAEEVLTEARSKLANLKPRYYLLSEPEDLVHLDWSEERED